MNNVFRNTLAILAACALFFLQVTFGSVSAGMFFFPAAVLYTASYMTLFAAGIGGGLIGILWDGASLMPFGMHALVLALCMGGVSFYMKSVDERSIGARAVIVFAGICVYGFVSGIFYFFGGEGTRGLLLHTYDIAANILVLGMGVLGHIIIARTQRI